MAIGCWEAARLIDGKGTVRSPSPVCSKREAAVGAIVAAEWYNAAAVAG